MERILATGNVHVESDDAKAAKVQSNRLELLMAEKGDTFYGRFKPESKKAA